MRSRLQLAPWWALSLFVGVTYSMLRAALDLVTGSEWGRALLIDSVLGGLFFGLVMGPTLAWMNNRSTTASGLDDRSEVLAAHRAAKRGPAPADPRLREAALRIAVHNEELNRSVLRFAVPGFALVAVVCVALAFFTSFWSLAAAALFAGFAAFSPWEIRRLERRVRVLSGPSGE